MKHVRNKELLPFYKLTEEEQQILEGEVHKGKVEWLCACANVATWYKKEEGDELLDDTVYRVV